MEPNTDLEDLLKRARDGDDEAAEGLIAATHDELRRLAGAIMRDTRANHTLQATALVNEAFMRIAEYGPGEVDDVCQFIRRTTRLMRNALIDHERARLTTKRGAGKAQLSMSVSKFGLDEGGGSGKNMIDVDAALKRLEEDDPELAKVVELKTFGGLGIEEIAEVLGLAERTAARRWRTARMWLLNDLTENG